MAQQSSSENRSEPVFQDDIDALREHPRLRCRGTAEMRFLELDTRVSGSIVDLSLCGCCIEIPGTLPKIELPVVEVLLTIDGTRLCLKGVVRNEHNGYRAGVEFVDVTPRKAEQIKELVDEIKEQWAENGGETD